MGVHLVSGGCGFVGRNMVKRIYNTTNDQIFFIDDLSVGIDPALWLDKPLVRTEKGIKIYGKDERLFFLQDDFRNIVHALASNPAHLKDHYGLDFVDFDDIYHFAAIVGGRAKIDGDPMMVALDLSIDAEFFYYITRNKPKRVLYPSSSAAYPVDLQTVEGAIALKESDIDFKKMGQPDMTYGWTKLTGEYLAKIAAEYYGVHITCIRPFSGYGEDQDLTYPIPSLARRAALKENPFEVWGSGLQGRDFVHIDDVIDCIQLAMNHISDGKAINIGMGKLTTFLEIIELMTSFANYKPEIKPLLDKPVGVHSRYCDMTWVNENLGWNARISVAEGMRRVYDAALNKYN